MWCRSRRLLVDSELGEKLGRVRVPMDLVSELALRKKGRGRGKGEVGKKWSSREMA